MQRKIHKIFKKKDKSNPIRTCTMSVWVFQCLPPVSTSEEPPLVLNQMLLRLVRAYFIAWTWSCASQALLTGTREGHSACQGRSPPTDLPSLKMHSPSPSFLGLISVRWSLMLTIHRPTRITSTFLLISFISMFISQRVVETTCHQGAIDWCLSGTFIFSIKIPLITRTASRSVDEPRQFVTQHGSQFRSSHAWWLSHRNWYLFFFFAPKPAFWKWLSPHHLRVKIGAAGIAQNDPREPQTRTQRGLRP